MSTDIVDNSAYTSNTKNSIKNKTGIFQLSVKLFIIDIIALFITFFIPWFFRIGIWGTSISSLYLIACLLSLGIFTFMAFNEKCYQEDRLKKPFDGIVTTSKAIILTFSILLFITFLLKETSSFSRIWATTWLMLFLSYVTISRFFIAKHIKKRLASGIGLETAIIIGKVPIAAAFEAFIKEHELNFELVGYSAQREEQKQYQGTLPWLGPCDEISQHIKKYKVDHVFIAEEHTNSPKIKTLLKEINKRSVNCYLVPDLKMEDGFASKRYRNFGAFSAAELSNKPIDRWPAIVKRIEDLTLSIIALLIIWPVLLITALAIKLESKGPVFFKQPRYGFNNELINVYKFRSMYTDMTDLHATQQTTKDDLRVTKVGKFIRKTSIDELPQLFNVLIGNMSLVGPRPHAAQTKAAGKLFEDVVDNYAIRHRVKPGITGLAQVNGWRGETDTEEKIIERVKHDLEYMRNWSFTLDIFILFKTVYALIFSSSKAY
ncbi:undecaprenyl-phosphate glucose phosphotransferase [Kordiimonas sp. SCSIO 12603]|uniref:undecaprenyl-phosphate glucose phosphotransferase n=1 Tax=Kordiimonas sp. SCSIO 12603 TaxID=2829596 RepID=UPI00210270CB|nr:undecaprenyl-phosphate glucose phosphotransferase [Kordiimonas sp. SCSIO 12603]UTW58948.1 undecaprenyl-phosphate glucose phosphotransferase [Kordiimonas sp. SCSIO 12603]